MCLYEKAAYFAIKKHEGQRRKLKRIPYIIHAMEVSAIIGTMTTDEEVLAAGILHDTVEDTGTTIEEIAELFSQRVADLVASETEQKRPDLPKEETWYIRKKESIDVLRNSKETAVKMLWLADKLSNMRSLSAEYEVHKDELWQRFNQKDKKMHEWYYREIADAVKELEQFEAYREYVSLLNRVFEN